MERPRILIVGGVAGGASAAARARRLLEDAEIVVFERGPYASYANCGLPYYLGGEIADRGKLLVADGNRLQGWLNLDVRTGCEVQARDQARRRARTGERTRRPGKVRLLDSRPRCGADSTSAALG